MQYRVAQPADYVGISDCLNSTGYYNPIDPSTLDGLLLVCVNDETVMGCIWAMYQGRHAYVDFLCVRPGASSRIAVRLILYMQKVLRTLGVRWVRGAIAGHNRAALRLALANGMVADANYTLVYKELAHGHEEDRDLHSDNDQTAVVSGAEPDPAVHTTSGAGGSESGGAGLVLPAEWGGPGSPGV